MNENTNTNVESDAAVEITAGEMLRNARTTGRRKREIQTISKQLCIREEFLEALESGDYTVIPEPVYILGFARNYAMELGLNPDEVIAKIKREMGISTDCKPDGETASCDAAAGTGPVGGGKSRFWERAASFARAKWKWISAVAIVILVCVFAAVGMMLIGGGSSDTGGSDIPVALVQTVPEPAYNKQVRERFGVENREKARVILQAVQESWVKIEDGRGNTVFSRVLVPGDLYYVPAGANYKATFGNAGGVDIWVDGSLADKVGAPYTRKSDISMNPDALSKSGNAVKTPDAAPTDDSTPAPAE